MNKFFKVSFLGLALSAVVLLSSCSDDPALPDNLANFQSDTQGLAASETDLTVNLTFVRAVDVAGNLVIDFTPTGVEYGTDFTTDPAAVNNSITIPVAAGATSASFKVTKTNTTGLQGDEKIVFTLQTVADGLLLGDKKTFTLSFSEIIASSATVNVDGGGATYPNHVFIDFSGNRQTAVARNTWDLGFASAGDQFRVVLNSANNMLVRAIDKNDLTTVTAADTTGFAAQLSVGAIFGIIATEDPSDYPSWLNQTTTWMDDPKGDLTKTAIASVSATDSENKVYIVNRGNGPGSTALGWKKIRVIRNGANYTLQHADIGSSTFQTLTITKNSAARFQFASLASNSVVNVEPNVGDWDIEWTAFTNAIPTGGPTDPYIPYAYQDMIVSNVSTVSTAQVLTSVSSYEAFNEASLASITLNNNNQILIGSSWRSTGPPPAPIGQKTDRFYVVKDGAGNVYKVQFTALTTNGERGKPQLKFDLVKKGS
ncbi:MAG: HmuY family protein [Bacteroidota bacterium]